MMCALGESKKKSSLLLLLLKLTDDQFLFLFGISLSIICAGFLSRGARNTCCVFQMQFKQKQELNPSWTIDWKQGRLQRKIYTQPSLPHHHYSTWLASHFSKERKKSGEA